MKKLSLILVLFTSFSSYSQLVGIRHNIIQSAIFEDARITGTFQAGSQSCFSYSQAISDTFLRYTTKSMRDEYRKGDSCVFGHRSEVVDTGSHLQERWFGLSIYPAVGFDVATFDGDVITQWHDNADPGEQNRSPALSLAIKAGRYQVKILADSNANNCPIGFSCTYMHQTNYDLGPVVQGEWNDWVYHFVMDYREVGIGLTQVWKNGVLVLNISGPNCFNDILYPYFKFGQYEPDITTVNTPFDDRVLWFANVREGNQFATYNDVAPPPPPPNFFMWNNKVSRY